MYAPQIRRNAIVLVGVRRAQHVEVRARADGQVQTEERRGRCSERERAGSRRGARRSRRRRRRSWRCRRRGPRGARDLGYGPLARDGSSRSSQTRGSVSAGTTRFAASRATPGNDGTPTTVIPGRAGRGDARLGVLERDAARPDRRRGGPPPRGRRRARASGARPPRRSRRRRSGRARPPARSARVANSRPEFVARPIGTPRSRSAAMSSRAPGIASTPAPSSSAWTSARSSACSSWPRPSWSRWRSIAIADFAPDVPSISRLWSSVNSTP